jgi:hypothetical protein
MKCIGESVLFTPSMIFLMRLRTMTDKEFEEYMDREGWTHARRRAFRDRRPALDADAFKREMARPDGLVELVSRNE